LAPVPVTTRAPPTYPFGVPLWRARAGANRPRTSLLRDCSYSRKRSRTSKRSLWCGNAANLANASSWLEVQDAARALAIKLQSRQVLGPSDFAGVFAAMAREHPDARLLIGDRLTLQHGKEIVNFANQKRIPSMLDRAYPETASVMMS